MKPLGITQVGKYEYMLVSGVKVDALYGHVLIEYKAPGKLSTDRDVKEARKQLIGYIVDETGVEERYRYFLRVILGDKICFCGMTLGLLAINGFFEGPMTSTVRRLLSLLRRFGVFSGKGLMLIVW